MLNACFGLKARLNDAMLPHIKAIQAFELNANEGLVP